MREKEIKARRELQREIEEKKERRHKHITTCLGSCDEIICTYVQCTCSRRLNSKGLSQSGGCKRKQNCITLLHSAIRRSLATKTYAEEHLFRIYALIKSAPRFCQTRVCAIHAVRCGRARVRDVNVM